MRDKAGSREFDESFIVEKLIRSRRTIRKFLPYTIHQEVVNRIIEAGTWAPSACNRQLWYFVIVRDPLIKEQLVHKAGAVDIILSAPIVIAVFYDRRHELSKSESTLSVGMAVQNMLLMARALGVGACPIAGVKNPSKVNDVLLVPRYYEFMLFVCLGAPAETPPPPTRCPIKDITSYNRVDKNVLSYPNVLDPDKWSLTQLALFKLTISWARGLDTRVEHINPKNDAGLCTLDLITRMIYDEIIKLRERVSDVKILDVFPWGGMYLREIIARTHFLTNSIKFYAYELCNELVDYTHERIKRSLLWDESIKLEFLINASSDKYLTPSNTDKFDIITATYRCNSIPRPIELLEECCRVLKSQGSLILSLVGKLNAYTSLYYYMAIKSKGLLNRSWFAITGPFKPRSIDRFLSFFTSKGFLIEEIYSVAPLKWSVYEITKRICTRLGLYNRIFSYKMAQQLCLASCGLKRLAIAYVIKVRKP